jgi:hypothetical protein
MTSSLPRRHVIALLAALVPLAPATPGAAADQPAGQGPEHDFDFFLGSWKVRHRRLRKRLAGSDDWEEFDGETTCIPLMGGQANLNDSVSYRGGKVYRGLGLRACDPKTGVWADWTLSAGNPLELDPPGLGRFDKGVGTFLSDDSFEGRPVKVRGIFSSLSPGLAQWEQAFSPDNGATWETNWVMRYARAT